ncbi:response regulator [Thalassobacillus pellis]|uniref:response regulator n=1 Tax=Thalassobacillus pellis TaxID=748008 RepID=UPI00195F49BF|nr:response regulator [Thalassobacillus pellis]MBM7553162.1 two-component system response regulator DctR [Thalassobacillus pellis]
MNILIIDDDQSLRYMLREICKYAGWDSVVAENGVEGLDKFREIKPDLALVDYHMPEMDGLKTVKKLREEDIHTPIIVLTVDERQEIADQFLQAGASDFALKPVKAPDIIARIQLHIRLANIQEFQNNEVDVYTTKGISKQTMNHISEYLQQQQDAIPVDQISKRVGLAYPTVYRYLMHLLEIGKVKQTVSHQKIGRPKKLYQWFTK